jgi:hypothetical protein
MRQARASIEGLWWPDFTAAAAWLAYVREVLKALVDLFQFHWRQLLELWA